MFSDGFRLPCIPSWDQPLAIVFQVGGVLKGGRFLLQRPAGAVPAQLAGLQHGKSDQWMI